MTHPSEQPEKPELDGEPPVVGQTHDSPTECSTKPSESSVEAEADSVCPVPQDEATSDPKTPTIETPVVSDIVLASFKPLEDSEPSPSPDPEPATPLTEAETPTARFLSTDRAKPANPFESNVMLGEDFGEPTENSGPNSTTFDAADGLSAFEIEERSGASGADSGFAAAMSSGAGTSALNPTAIGGPIANASPTTNSVATLALTWASLATLISIWFWWNRPSNGDSPAYLPSDGAVAALAGKVLNPLENPGPRMTFRIGDSKRIGDVEFTPLAIEQRKVAILDGDNAVATTVDALVLRIRAKHVGTGAAFVPFDPKYQSLVDRSTGRRNSNAFKLRGRVIFENGYTYTFAHPIADPMSMNQRILPIDATEFGGVKVQGQNFTAISAGESTEGWVVSQEDCIDLVNGEMLWRVKIRKGLTPSGKGVAAVLGVRFSPTDVSKIEDP